MKHHATAVHERRQDASRLGSDVTELAANLAHDADDVEIGGRRHRGADAVGVIPDRQAIAALAVGIGDDLPAAIDPDRELVAKATDQRVVSALGTDDRRSIKPHCPGRFPRQATLRLAIPNRRRHRESARYVS